MAQQEQSYFTVSLHPRYASVLEVARACIVISVTTELFKITLWYNTSVIFLVLKYRMLSLS